jgi:hypothetical protein
MKAGATDNGKPGVRSQYHRFYYGAFVLDPEGRNLEVVCHKPAFMAGDGVLGKIVEVGTGIPGLVGILAAAAGTAAWYCGVF